MKYEIPKTSIMGKPVQGSLERVLAGLNKDPQIQPSQIQPLVNAPNLTGYVFVPSINLYVSKERTHTGLNWNQTHETLQSEGLRMPTIPQFLVYLKFLQNGHQDRNEAQGILDDILKVGNWRGEWLDAKFKYLNGQMSIFYNHVLDQDGNLMAQNEVLTLDYLKEDCRADVFGSANSQGLPTRKLGNSYEQGKNSYFWFPRDGAVAGFGAYSVRGYFNCYRDPTNAVSSLGVFACAEGASKK